MPQGAPRTFTQLFQDAFSSIREIIVFALIFRFVPRQDAAVAALVAGFLRHRRSVHDRQIPAWFLPGPRQRRIILRRRWLSGRAVDLGLLLGAAFYLRGRVHPDLRLPHRGRLPECRAVKADLGCPPCRLISGEPQPALHLGDWQFVPVTVQILRRGQRSRLHPVNIHRAV